MKLNLTRMAAVLLSACGLLVLGACQKHAESHHDDHPAHVDHISDDLALVTLTDKAAQRIGLEYGEVEQGEEEGTLMIPYSSILYDAQGKTWVYVSPKPNQFKRHEVVVDRVVTVDKADIEDNPSTRGRAHDGGENAADYVVITSGPEAGTKVATVGMIEIWGSEFEVGH
jgi:hypothetical protein